MARACRVASRCLLERPASVHPSARARNIPTTTPVKAAQKVMVCSNAATRELMSTALASFNEQDRSFQSSRSRSDQPRLQSHGSACHGQPFPWLPSAPSDRPVRREHPSARGQGARQWQAAHATAAASWMRSRSPLLGGPARVACGVGNAAAARVAAGNGWCVEDRSRCRSPAFRAGAWVPELCHWPHRREGSASFARVVVDRHDVSSRSNPSGEMADKAGRAAARPARLVTRPA